MTTYYALQNKASDTTLFPQPDGSYGLCFYFPVGPGMFLASAKNGAAGDLVPASQREIDELGPYAKIAYTVPDDA